ncbi:hypothetical protein GW17_00026109 [Ensete ventricosum]|nr:hypothetical protein GW17_00026109 [Ensete ventricosum]
MNAAVLGGAVPVPSFQAARKEWRAVTEHSFRSSGGEVRSKGASFLDKRIAAFPEILVIWCLWGKRLIFFSGNTCCVKVQEGTSLLDVDPCSVTTEGVGELNDDILQQKLQEITRHRERLQQMEIELRARAIARSDILEVQNSFEGQLKEQIDFNANLKVPTCLVLSDNINKEQLHEREQHILELEMKLEEKDRELHAMKIDTEAVSSNSSTKVGNGRFRPSPPDSCGKKEGDVCSRRTSGRRHMRRTLRGDNFFVAVFSSSEVTRKRGGLGDLVVVQQIDRLLTVDFDCYCLLPGGISLAGTWLRRGWGSSVEEGRRGRSKKRENRENLGANLFPCPFSISIRCRPPLTIPIQEVTARRVVKRRIWRRGDWGRRRLEQRKRRSPSSSRLRLRILLRRRPETSTAFDAFVAFFAECHRRASEEGTLSRLRNQSQDQVLESEQQCLTSSIMLSASQSSSSVSLNGTEESAVSAAHDSSILMPGKPLVEPNLLDERSLLACIVRAVPAGSDGRIRISTTLFVLEGDFIHLREGAQQIISATAAVAKVAAASASSAPYISLLPSVAVTPVAQISRQKMAQSIESKAANTMPSAVGAAVTDTGDSSDNCSQILTKQNQQPNGIRFNIIQGLSDVIWSWLDFKEIVSPYLLKSFGS